MAFFLGTFMALLSAVAIWFLLSLGASGKPVEETPLGGLWLSDGYGLLVEFDDRGLRTYELTSSSCVPSRSAKRFVNGGPDSGFTLRQGARPPGLFVLMTKTIKQLGN